MKHRPSTETTGEMKFTCYQYADISTGYLDEQDLGLIGPGAPNHLAELDGGEGDFFYVPLDDVTDDFIEDANKHGLSQRFIDIMLELQRQNIPYVRFDRDGAEVDGMLMTDETEAEG